MTHEIFVYLMLAVPIYGILCAGAGAAIYYLICQKSTEEAKKAYREGRDRYERLIKEVRVRNKIDTETFKYVLGAKE